MLGVVVKVGFIIHTWKIIPKYRILFFEKNDVKNSRQRENVKAKSKKKWSNNVIVVKN